MKIILSRKGFDDQYGGHPSIILPEGNMISFPIPVKLPELGVGLNELYYEENSFEKIFSTLGIKQLVDCQYHLDPDIRYNSKKVRSKNWIGAFGQSGAASSHLKNHGINKDDIFLFYGTFKFTKYLRPDVLEYDKSYPFHAIWGYLIVDEIIKDLEMILTQSKYSYLTEHPHFINRNIKQYKTGNSIYTGREFGTFKFNDILRLSKLGYNKSYWELPNFFKEIDLTFHDKNKFEIDTQTKSCLIQTVGKGQEFIFEANSDSEIWVQQILKNVCSDKFYL